MLSWRYIKNFVTIAIVAKVNDKDYNEQLSRKVSNQKYLLFRRY